MKPLVSVIVPCYNMAAFLEETLRSIVDSDYRQLEVIVIDDGSTDNSVEKAEAFFNNLQTYTLLTLNSHILRQPNSGVSAARNNGLQHAQGKYILPVDADDRISPTFISHAVEAMEANPALKVVYSRAEFFGERTGEWHLPKYSPALLARKNMIPATALFRREDALAIGGYCTEDIFREDWDFWLSMLERDRINNFSPNVGEVAVRPEEYETDAPISSVLQLDEVGFYYRIRSGSRRSISSAQKRQMIDLINRRHREFLYMFLGGPLHYHRTWSRFLNVFRSEKLIGPIGPISPIGHISVLHQGRNTLFEQDGLVIKQFAKPNFLKAILYGWFLKSKARRSYEYAGRLLTLGIATPEPIAYQEVRICGFLRDSYYVSRKSTCPHTLQELIGPISLICPIGPILEAIAMFIAKLHDAGVSHRDLSPGNILFDDEGHVEIIDLNRISWKGRPLDFETGCQNFERLNIGREALTVMAKAYAEARGFDPQQCIDYILSHRWYKHVRQGITNL